MKKSKEHLARIKEMNKEYEEYANKIKEECEGNCQIDMIKKCELYGECDKQKEIEE